MDGPQKEQDAHKSEEVLQPDLSETVLAPKVSQTQEDIRNAALHRLPLHVWENSAKYWNLLPY